MSLGENGSSLPATMLVSPTGGMPYPVYTQGGGGNGGSNGWGDGSAFWLIILFLILAGNGNWGGNNNGNGFGGGTPIIVNDGANGSVQRGFDQAAVMSGIDAARTGINGLSTQLCNCCGDMQQSLCNGFAGVNATINSTAANAETAANARAMANMQQLFGLQTNLSDYACENRLGTADLKYTIATENCSDRYASAQNTRDIIENCNRNNQAILDKLCQLELDGKNDKIADLERQLTMANLNASQVAQTARIREGQVAEIDAMYQRLRDCPVPSMPVYGMQPIFTCNGNSCGCGCGNNNF